MSPDMSEDVPGRPGTSNGCPSVRSDIRSAGWLRGQMTGRQVGDRGFEPQCRPAGKENVSFFTLKCGIIMDYGYLI